MKYTLKCAEACAIVSSHGGELVSFTKGKEQYIWTGEEKYWEGHAPALFPIVGSLKDGKVVIEGKEMCFNQHGFVLDSELELLEISDTKAVFELRENENTLKSYPYKFSFKITHEICGNGFTTTYTVTNTDGKDMPFCIGAHPGFYLENIEDYKLVFECDEDTALGYPDENSLYSYDYELGFRFKGREWNLKYSDFDVDTIFFKDLKSRRVSVVEKKTNLTRLTFDFNGFSEFVMWSPPKMNAPFVCLEPWNGLPALIDETGKFLDKPHCRVLKSGETYSVCYSVEI